MKSVPNPLPSRLYYGWVIVAVALTTNIVAAPLNPIIFSFFLRPMSDDLGWSRSSLSWALTLRIVASGVAGPVIGVLVDRYGARWLGVVAGLLAGASVMALGAVHHLGVLYLLYAVSGIAGIGGGPGGNLLTLVPVAKWFVALRGRATAIATIGLAIGTVTGIPVARWLIDELGWRQAWVIFGAAVAVVTVPLYALFMRRAPEDLGLLPDGATTEPGLPQALRRGPQELAERDWTVGQAMRTPALWLIIGGFSLMGLALSGTLVHRIGFWEETGISPGLIAFGTAMDPFTVIFSALLFGIVGERLPLRYMGLIGGAGFALSTLPLIFASDHAYLVFLHNFIWGATAGAHITTNNLIWPSYFGRKLLGTIRGLVLPLTIASTGISAPLYGYLLDHGLEPKVLWSISLGLFSTGGILLFLATPPAHPAAQAATKYAKTAIP